MSIGMPKGALYDPKNIMRDISGIGNWTGANYDKVIKSDENYTYILGLVRQSLEYDRKRARSKKIS